MNVIVGPKVHRLCSSWNSVRTVFDKRRISGIRWNARGFSVEAKHVGMVVKRWIGMMSPFFDYWSFGLLP